MTALGSGEVAEFVGGKWLTDKENRVVLPRDRSRKKESATASPGDLFVDYAQVDVATLQQIGHRVASLPA